MVINPNNTNSFPAATVSEETMLGYRRGKCGTCSKENRNAHCSYVNEEESRQRRTLRRVELAARSTSGAPWREPRQKTGTRRTTFGTCSGNALEEVGDG